LTSRANAYADGCAVVLKTPDGFLNLHKEPKMGSKIVRRLKPGQLIVVAGETMAKADLRPPLRERPAP
jgi:hypothetical protein